MLSPFFLSPPPRQPHHHHFLNHNCYITITFSFTTMRTIFSIIIVMLLLYFIKKYFICKIIYVSKIFYTIQDS
jgi:hypothetical protein